MQFGAATMGRAAAKVESAEAVLRDLSVQAALSASSCLTLDQHSAPFTLWPLWPKASCPHAVDSPDEPALTQGPS